MKKNLFLHNGFKIFLFLHDGLKLFLSYSFSICAKKINLKKSHAKLRILMRQTIKYARATFKDHSFGLQVAPRFKHCLKNTKICFQGPVKCPQDQTTKKNIRLESYTEK
jgi:hypothetical protein